MCCGWLVKNFGDGKLIFFFFFCLKAYASENAPTHLFVKRSNQFNANSFSSRGKQKFVSVRRLRTNENTKNLSDVVVLFC